MRAADLGDPRPPGPAPLDGVIQRPSARAERGVDDHEQEEHEKEGERDGQLEEADRRREETGVRAHGLAPEAEPRLKPAGLARAGVGDHLGQRVRDPGLEFQGSVDGPDNAEDHPDRGLQKSHVPYEPVVQVHLDGSHRGASRNSTCSTIPGVGTYTVQLKPASGRPPSFPVADRSQPGLRAAHRARIDTAAAIWDWGNYSQKYVLAAKYG